MGMLVLKNVAKKGGSSSIRYVFRNIEFNFSPSNLLYNIPKRHLQLGNTNSPSESEIKKELQVVPLVRRLYGNTNPDHDGFHYFSQLSPQDLSPQKHLHLPFDHVEVVGSCNGLLCLLDRLVQGRLALWNPFTGESEFLPPTCIKLHPCASRIYYSCAGIGYDFNSQDYKVIRFLKMAFDDAKGPRRVVRHAELYSVNSGSWKEIPDFGSLYLRNNYSYTAHVNGVFYWLATGTVEDQLLSFDFANQTFSCIALPEPAKHTIKPHMRTLLEWDGSLGLIICPLYGPDKTFDSWVRNDGSWRRVSMFTVSGAVRPLAFWSKNQLIFESIHHEATLLDLDTREVRRLGIYDHPRTLEFIPCVESQVQLNPPKPDLEADNKEPSEGFHEQIQTVPVAC